jgi:hypothetical protein
MDSQLNACVSEYFFTRACSTGISRGRRLETLSQQVKIESEAIEKQERPFNIDDPRQFELCNSERMKRSNSKFGLDEAAKGQQFQIPIEVTHFHTELKEP